MQTAVCLPPEVPPQIWAWEYVKQDPVAYWAGVPAEVKPRLHCERGRRWDG